MLVNVILSHVSCFNDANNIKRRVQIKVTVCIAFSSSF